MDACCRRGTRPSPGYKPPRPPTVALVAQTREVVLSLAVYPDHEKLVGCDFSAAFRYGSFVRGKSYAGARTCRIPLTNWPCPPTARLVGIDRDGRVFAWDAQSLTPIIEAAALESYAGLLGRATGAKAVFQRLYEQRSGDLRSRRKGIARRPNQESVVVLLDQGTPEYIQLAISDDGLYTAVMALHAPQSSVYVFETEHLLRAPQWPEPDDLVTEAINSCGDDGNVQEMVFSPD